MPAHPAAIAVEGLEVSYGAHRALSGVSLSVAPGEVVALLGPNGAGKTTAARCIAGMRRPDGGNARVLGLDPAADRDRMTRVLGVMPQTPGCHRQATPRELLRTHARFFADPLDPDELVARAGLGEVARRRIRTLSGGEVQRCSLALALVGRPRVLLLDEPSSGIDPHGRRHVWGLLAELAADGVGILMTTHSLDEAARVADTVVVLDRGVVRAWDTPASLSASAGRGLLLETPDELDADALAADLRSPVEALGGGRWRVDATSDRIPEVAAWFARTGCRLSGIRADVPDLEDVYLRLTAREDEP
ncbi:ABC transporter ATP-binding protein [Egibacter rhizosphaerae]|nr:ABC transporter ATP-binding protein [Egibacter rhizosphaerae]